MRGGTIRRRIGSSMAIVMFVLGLAPASARAGGPTTIYVYIGGCGVNGAGIPSTSYTITLRNAENELKGRATVMSNGSGFWYTPCFNESVEVHDTIKVTGPDVRTMTVPRLTAVADRVADTISGKGPANSSLSVTAIHTLLLGNQWGTSKTKTAATGASGDYSISFATFDPRGADYYYVLWTSAHNDNVFYTGSFPYLQVWRNQTRTTGAAPSGALVSATLRDSGNVQRGTARDVVQVPTGYFYTSFRNASLDPVYVHASDKVSSSIASDAHFTVPAVTLSGNPATNVISGTCLANRPFLVSAYDPTYSRPDYSTIAYGTTNGAGGYSVDVTANEPSFNLTAGDKIEVDCAFASGDAVGRLGTAAS
jgi:hypothetical protein